MKQPTFSLTPEELAEMSEEYQREYFKHEEKLRRQTKSNLKPAPSHSATYFQEYRLSVAIHEAAHLVAAAYTGAEILEVRICTEKGKDVINGKGTAMVAGYCSANHSHPVKNALIGLAGWAWDESFPGPYLGRRDYTDVQAELSRKWVLEKYGDQFEAVKAEALAFVQKYEQLISDTGNAIFNAAKADGKLRKKPWGIIEAGLRTRFRKR